MWWLRHLEKAGLGQRLSHFDFGGNRAGETIFVFGTGASINSYPATWWDIVEKHDSVAMNFFLLHDHVPTYHVMEDVHGIRAQLLRHRYIELGDYRDTPLILKSQLTNLSSNRVNERMEELGDLPSMIRSLTYLSLDFVAAGRSVGEVEDSYRKLAQRGLWTPKSKFLVLSKRRGSVSFVINLAVRAGYRRIVLCGIDLNHTEYFYDSLRTQLEDRGLPVPINDETGKVHSTNDPDQDPVTMHEVIVAIKDAILDPMGVDLMVGSADSALFPDLPLYQWELEGEAVQRNASGDDPRDR